jgi:hypothetical protein
VRIKSSVFVSAALVAAGLISCSGKPPGSPDADAMVGSFDSSWSDEAGGGSADDASPIDSPSGDAASSTDAGGSADGPAPRADAHSDSAVTPGSDSGPDAASDSGSTSGGGTCSSPSGCRTYSNYCGGCTCDALGVSAPNPTCDASLGSCLVDPCTSHTAVCDSTHHCALQ